MTQISKRALVPYTVDKMFALVNDVEAYPEFLPWCTDVNLLDRNEQQLTAEIELSKGRIQQAFTTKNSMVRDQQITMQLVKGPFKKLHGIWQFHPRGDLGCEVTLDMEFEFGRGLLGFGFGKVFGGVANSLVDSFCQRAKQLYG